MEQHEVERENADKSSNNTEYVPTKCRITRPPPPKPATNPLQFIKVAPCPLYRKAQEQLKKVEEIKTTKQHIREEAEDWQQNLDNWKSSRRKRQEDIIERVIEVKKFEQEDHERSRKKSKTFSEMMEDRNRGRHKFNIPIFDDDSNDLSDYGIGSSSSKTNSIKDVDTDDNSSILDDKDNGHFDLTSSRDANVSAQSQSEDELLSEQKPKPKPETFTSSYTTSLYTNKQIPVTNSLYKLYNTSDEEPKKETEQYTYEGAIQDYRTRIKSKINISESIFNKNAELSKSKEYLESQAVVPKGQIFKRKEIFEIDKPLEIHHIGSSTSRRLSEDFVNTQSIKERLQSFEKCSEQANKNTPIKTRLQNLNKKDDTRNNNFLNIEEKDNKTANSTYATKADRCSSPETEMYMNKLNMFSNDLDNLFGKHSHNSENELDDFGSNSNYPASTSSAELMGLCSDREDSGIHTADVSCSVSQADEPVELSDLSNTIPNCIEKLTLEKTLFTKDFLIKTTKELLDSLRKDCENYEPKTKVVVYENVELKPLVLDALSSDFPLAPPRVIEPPKVKPPPPPPPETEEKSKPNIKRLNSAKRIKKEIHIKRSSFLGLSEPFDDQLDTEIDKPPDIYSFLQKESKLEKSLYKKIHESTEGSLSKVGSQDSGLDVERGRLSSDTWCSSVGDSSTISHGRQDSEHTNSVTSEEDEIMKKEREIIEMVEKEEKSRDSEYNQPAIFRQQFDDEQDSEVLKVEHELLQLEKEQLRRQQEQFLFNKRLQANRHSMENVCDEFGAYSRFTDGVNYRKSMPELQHVPEEYRKSLPDPYNRKLEVQYHRKSMPDIQHAYNKSTVDYQKPTENNLGYLVNHRKSMPELKSAFSSPMLSKQPIMPGKPLMKDRDSGKPRHLSRHHFPAVNPAPKIIPSDNWIQSKANPETKKYNQHWLYQEAELRRISEQTNRTRPQKQEKHIPDSVIKSLKQRVQNKNRSDVQPLSYINLHSQTLGHALPMSYPPPVAPEETQDRVLSVSGKKKCSYCGNELGRGAAMIIESLCLFYHMECFKCCVCHMQLGDGMMGTDVRVRNQKLHCHNCYSSDDGVKFSCV